MSKILIVTDSGAGIRHTDLLSKYKNLEVLDLDIVFGKTSISEEDTSCEQFYDMLLQNEDVPKTSQPKPGELLSLLESKEKEGYTDLIFITLSSGISGTYQTALTASSIHEGTIKLHVVDSLSTCVVQEYLTRKACEMVENSKSPSEIVIELKKMASQNQSLILVDDLKYLIKNGRLKGAQAFVGSMLKVKPITEINYQTKGEIHTHSKVRTSSKAVKSIVAILKEYAQGKNVDFFFGYCKKNETYQLIKEELKTQTPELYENMIERNIVPVIASHIGAYAYTLQFIVKE